MSIGWISIALKDRSTIVNAICIQDGNNCIILLTEVQLFVRFSTNSMLSALL